MSIVYNLGVSGQFLSNKLHLKNRRNLQPCITYNFSTINQNVFSFWMQFFGFSLSRYSQFICFQNHQIVLAWVSLFISDSSAIICTSLILWSSLSCRKLLALFVVLFINNEWCYLFPNALAGCYTTGTNFSFIFFLMLCAAYIYHIKP